jgi:hypothetical protein
VGSSEFPGSKEHPVSSSLIEKRKEINFRGGRVARATRRINVKTRTLENHKGAAPRSLTL